jgi:hypothetical protein
LAQSEQVIETIIVLIDAGARFAAQQQSSQSVLRR